MLPNSMPGSRVVGAVHARGPVTFGTPSGRIGRVPTHLKRFTEFGHDCVVHSYLA